MTWKEHAQFMMRRPQLLESGCLVLSSLPTLCQASTDPKQALYRLLSSLKGSFSNSILIWRGVELDVGVL